LQDIYVIFLDQIRKELQEKREQQQPDMHTIGIGIGGDDHLVVAKPFHVVFDIEGCLQQIEFLVFVNDFFF